MSVFSLYFEALVLIKEGGYTSRALKGHLLQTVASDASRGSSAILQGRKQRQAALKCQLVQIPGQDLSTATQLCFLPDKSHLHLPVLCAPCF